MIKRLSVYSFLISLLIILPSQTCATEAGQEEQWPVSPATELLRLLEDLDEQYGRDTVILLNLLLDATIRSGSVLTASVRVNGIETHDNSTFLTFEVETGLILHGQTSDQTARLAVLWEKILAEAFAPLDMLHVPADGLMIKLRYYHRPYEEAAGQSEVTDEPGATEEARFYFQEKSLQAFLSKKLSAQALLINTLVLVDNTPALLTLPQSAAKQRGSGSHHPFAPSKD